MKTKVFLVFCFFMYVRTEDECSSNDVSCQQCLKKPLCSWKLSAVESSESRCIASSKNGGKDIYNPDSSLDIIQNEPINEQYQLSPQKVQLKLRLYKPVYFNVTFTSTADSVVIPNHPDIIVGLTREQPDKGLIRIEALRCPKDPSEYKQNIYLSSFQSQQKIILETEILCACPEDKE